MLDTATALAWLDGLEHFEAFLTDVHAACEAQGIPVDSAISGNGGGQFEANLPQVADPLGANALGDGAPEGSGLMRHAVAGLLDPRRASALVMDPAAGATLPRDWKRAIEAFERTERRGRIPAPAPRNGFAGMKKRESQVFSPQISPFEHETYLGAV